MRLSFGKHNGKDISEVPSTYLDWLIRVLRNDPYSREMREEISKELATRRRR